MRIAFVGPKSAGKTTSASLVSDVVGGAKILSFATPLKLEVYNLFQDIFDYFVYRQPAKSDEEKVQRVNNLKEQFLRKALQDVGTYRRNEDRNYWINQMAMKLKLCEGNVIVDDCRYINEAELLKAQGFTLIKIQPPVGNIDGNGSHSSEQEWQFIECDYLVVNRKENLGSLKNDLLAILGKVAFEG